MKKVLTLFTALILFGSMMVVQADITVRAKVPSQWTDNIYVYLYNSGSANGWHTTTQDGEWYTFTCSESSINVIFVNSTAIETWPNDANRHDQTEDITSVTADACYQINYNSTATSKSTFSATACPGEGSYTFTSGTTIYYDFTGYEHGVNLYNSVWNNQWKDDDDVDAIIPCTLTSDWEVTANTTLFRSNASGWGEVKCTTLPTDGQNMLVSTDGINYHWDTYVPSADPDPIPSYTFPAGTKIYYDFTGYEYGVNLYNSVWSNEWKDDTDVEAIIPCTLTTAWEVNANTTLFRSDASGWAAVKCTTLPTEGQNMLVSTDGINYHWDTYVDLTTDFYLAGSFNGWNTTADRFMKATADATEASVTINVSEYSNITFKVMEGAAYCGSSDAITKDAPSATIAAAGQGGDIAMTPYAAGNYIFTLNLSTRVLTVTYPDGEQMPIPQNIYLVGQMNSWEENSAYKFAVSGDVATLSVNTSDAFEAMHDGGYEFKIKHNGAWLGANYDFKYYWCSDVAFSTSEGSNAKIYTFKPGTYTFTYNLTSGELSIAYPATSATAVVISEYEYATLYSATAFDVPAEVEAYVISGVDGIKLTMEPIYRIPANTGVLLHAPQGSYDFYEGDGRWMDAPASNLLKGTTADQEIDNALVHYVLSYDNDYQIGFFWPYGTGATQGVGPFTNMAGKAYLEIPANSQPAGVVARRGFPFYPAPDAATGLENIETQGDAQKVIFNGQLLIIRDGRVFNAQGARVQ